MDITLCEFNPENFKIRFAGANIPLYIARLNKQSNSFDLIKYKSDKILIGIYL